MRIDVAGIGKFDVLDKETLMTSDAMVLIGCQRCGTTCTGYGARAALCKCCRSYGVRTRGGQPTNYPEDGKRHVTLMPIARFRDRMGEAA